MDVIRKPHHIFLIEHLLYPLVGSIFIILSLNYGIKLTARYSDLPPQQSAAFLYIALYVVICIGLYILIPFSCYRLWLSAEKYLEGTKRVISKIYAGTVIVVLIFFGLQTLVELPAYIDLFGRFI